MKNWYWAFWSNRGTDWIGIYIIPTVQIKIVPQYFYLTIFFFCWEATFGYIKFDEGN